MTDVASHLPHSCSRMGPVMSTFPFLLAQHLGDLHAWEQALVVLLAFGPFILLGIVVVVVRRRDIAEEDAEHQARGADTGGDTPAR